MLSMAGHPSNRGRTGAARIRGKRMNSISVLLVDDSPVFVSIARRFLHTDGDLIVVGQAGGGQEALARARDLRPQVVLLDLRMPDLPGLEVIPRLRAILPEVGIVVLTLLEGNGYREAALAAGADEFVAKAAMSADLLPAIRRVAQLRRPGQADASRPISGGER
jgi:DNA-binding NarL/FixJ family response regulator